MRNRYPKVLHRSVILAAVIGAARAAASAQPARLDTYRDAHSGNTLALFNLNTSRSSFISPLSSFSSSPSSFLVPPSSFDSASLGPPARPSPGFFTDDILQYAPSFGLTDPAGQLRPTGSYRDDLGMAHIRFQQVHHGIDVYGGELTAHYRSDGELSSITGMTLPPELLPDRTVPLLTANQAAHTAINRLTGGGKGGMGDQLRSLTDEQSHEHDREYELDHGQVAQVARATTFRLLHEPRLYFYDQRFLGLADEQQSPKLAWEVPLTSANGTSAVNVYLDARSAAVIRSASQEQHLTRRIRDCSYPWIEETITCPWDLYEPRLDYTFGRSEGQPPRGPNPVPGFNGSTDVDRAYDLTALTGDYYWTRFGRNGATNTGTGEISHFYSYSLIWAHADWFFGCPGAIAFSANNSIGFCPGAVVNDIFGHEYAHKVADYRSQNADGSFNSLAFGYQPGALNESNSDIFGEALEQTLTGSRDWVSGTEVDRIRNLVDPPAALGSNQTSESRQAHPDRFHSPIYYCGQDDRGGEHLNSTVPSKAAYLTSEGGLFNNFSIDPIGFDKVQQIWYRALIHYYANNETFNGAYIALRQSTRDLYGEYSYELIQLTKALRSVELDQPGLCSGLPLFLWGDLNRDGRIDGIDHTLFVGRLGQSANGYEDPYDFDGDGQIGSSDEAYLNFRLTGFSLQAAADTNWNNPASWQPGSIPDGVGTRITLGPSAGPITLTLDRQRTIGQLVLNSPQPYTITGGEPLRLDYTIATASIEVLQGHHTITAPITLASNTRLTIADGASLALADLTLNPGITLDLTDSSLIILASPATKNQQLTTLSTLIATARNNGDWLGTGITSSAAAADASHLTGLALILNDDGTGQPLHTTFAGQPVTQNDILIKYTYNGDADLNGVVDADDYFRIDNGFASLSALSDLRGYFNGDFDYSGQTDADDYFLIDSAFAGQSTTLGLPAAAVPEPALGLLILAGMSGLASRNRLTGGRNAPT